MSVEWALPSVVLAIARQSAMPRQNVIPDLALSGRKKRSVRSTCAAVNSDFVGRFFLSVKFLQTSSAQQD